MRSLRRSHNLTSILLDSVSISQRGGYRNGIFTGPWKKPYLIARSRSYRRPRLIERTVLTQIRTLSSTKLRTSITSSPSEAPKVLINDMANQELLIDFNDGDAIRYPSFWLRDNCQCSECSHPHTHQRQIDTFTIDPDVKISSINPTASGLDVVWANSADHTSHFSWPWLQRHPPFPRPVSVTKSIAPVPRSQTWLHHPPAHRPLPSTPYDSIMSSDAGLKSWIHQIYTYGLSFVPSTPSTPEATEALLERISFIRPTHYGGFWDFTSNPTPIDTAYTDSALPAHTDTTYFTDSAGLQLFHCLQPAASGGESTFIDGFAAANYLYKINPKAYHALSSIPIASSAEGSSAGIFRNTSLYPQGYPVFVHIHPPSSPSSSLVPRNLVQVRWNNLDRSPLTTFPNHTVMKTWYSAAKIWSQILTLQEDFEIEVGLKPGEPVIFDNWRVLHGRRAFGGGDGSGGQRRICGGYINMDDFLARGRALGLDM